MVLKSFLAFTILIALKSTGQLFAKHASVWVCLMILLIVSNVYTAIYYDFMLCVFIALSFLAVL